MEYINVHDIPADFLRARFKIFSAAQTCGLTRKFVPVARVLTQRATKDEKARFGIKGIKASGKSTLAATLIKEIGQSDRTNLISGNWSTLYTIAENLRLISYDAHALKLITATATMMSLVSPESWNSHLEQHRRSNAHIVEWPEFDTNPNFSCLFDFCRVNANYEDPARYLDYYCPDEIAAMPQTQQFLKDAAEFRIA